MERKIYAIIVTYNAMKWIDRCLGSLAGSSEKILPVVIDNMSTDNTVNYIKMNYPEVKLIVNSENLGFGRANNQGIEFAYNNGGTHFLLLNQDAWIMQDTVKILADIQDEYKIGIVSPIHLNGTGTIIDQQFFEYSIVNEHNRELVSDILLGNCKDLYYVDFVNAAAWMLSKQCIDTVGGFDPLFFIYGEDSNYCQRVHYHKLKVAIAPSAHIIHDREIHGNAKVYNKRAVLSLLLKSYANINEKPWKISKTRFVFHMWMIKQSVKYLIHLQFKEFGYIVQGYGTFITLLPSIKKSRAQNILMRANHLSLNNCE